MNELEPEFDVPADAKTQEALLYQIDHLRVALVSRDIIGQAKGMIRLLASCDDATAFDALSRLSQHTNRKLRDVAALIVNTLAQGEPLPIDLAAVLDVRLDQRRATSDQQEF